MITVMCTEKFDAVFCIVICGIDGVYAKAIQEEEKGGICVYIMDA